MDQSQEQGHEVVTVYLPGLVVGDRLLISTVLDTREIDLQFDVEQAELGRSPLGRMAVLQNGVETADSYDFRMIGSMLPFSGEKYGPQQWGLNAYQYDHDILKVNSYINGIVAVSDVDSPGLDRKARIDRSGRVASMWLITEDG